MTFYFAKKIIIPIEETVLFNLRYNVWIEKDLKIRI